jgi:two-component system CheB/CheR fusion protein
LQDSNDSLRSEVAVRQAAEQALAIASGRLDSTMAAAEIGGWMWDFERKELTVDRNFAALYGFADESALVGEPDLRLQKIHLQDRAAVEAAERDALITGILSSVEYRILQPGGQPPRWVISRGRVLRDADGTARRITGLLIDITAQKRADEERQANERVYRAIGESIEYGIWICDETGRNTYTSDSFLRLTGMSQAQCAEFGWGDVLHPAERDATLRAWAECVALGKPWYREHRIRGVDGHYHPILAQGVPIFTDDQRIAGWTGINLDISRLKRTEDALREADRRKDDFLATLAHELRNPLAPIRHATHILGSAAASEAQCAASRDVIARQVQHMALLLDDLLEISRITRGRLELRRSPSRLEELVASALEIARPLIEARNHQVDLDLPVPSPVLDVDPLRISQALANLLTNAAKYTDANGRITIRARVIDGGISISVSDTGMGLSVEAIPRLFEMFSQVHGVLERSQGGLGIGLAIVKGLLGLHDGTVSASSPGLGLGSTFTIRLPSSALVDAAPNCRPAASQPAAAPLQGASSHRVLVADDNRDSAESLAMLLRLDGYDVRIAASGSEAFDIASSERIEMMILDIGMPGMTGYEVAERIRQLDWGSCRPLLIALTGWGRQEDIDRARAAGFDHHLRKPVDLSELHAHLAAYCSSHSESSHA